MQETAQVVGLNMIANMIGAGVQIDVAGVLAYFQMAGAAMNLFATALTFDQHAGTHIDLHSAVHVDHHSGMHFDMHDGMHASIESGLTTTIQTTGSMTLASGATIDLKTFNLASNTQTLNATETAAIRLAQTHMTL